MTGLEKSRQVWTNFDISLMQKLVHKMQYFQSVFFQIRYSSRVLNYYSSSPPLSSLLVYNYFSNVTSILTQLARTNPYYLRIINLFEWN